MNEHIGTIKNCSKTNKDNKWFAEKYSIESFTHHSQMEQAASIQRSPTEKAVVEMVEKFELMDRAIELKDNTNTSSTEKKSFS